MVVTEALNVKDFKELQALKAFEPMLVTLLGIVTPLLNLGVYDVVEVG